MFWFDPIGTERRSALHRRDGMSYFARENRRSDALVLPKMVDRQVDEPIEEIREEVVNDLLHCPPGSSNGSVRTTKRSRLGPVIGKAPSGFANALSGLGGFVHNCCSSLFQNFLYRFSA
ncbi:unnamed protein product [Haemonchus placei]|uniref:Uncharacterized protein n=1 Tax=Haemonchus placei TaxID=6290 RepID=A0A0N4W9Y0_HAEPC|nr:unnamed protein product [Haemonchus placei]